LPYSNPDNPFSGKRPWGLMLAQAAVGTVLVMFGWLPVGAAIGWAWKAVGLSPSNGLLIGAVVVFTALLIYGAHKLLDRLWGWSPYE